MTSIKELAKLLKEVSILYVEDEDEIREEVAQVLSLLSNRVITASDGEEAFKIFSELKPQIIITDIEMPRTNGIEFARLVREKDLQVPIIMFTAYTNKEYLLPAANLNIQAYLVKPLESKSLREALYNVVELLQLTANLTYHISSELIYDKVNGIFVYQEKDTIKLNKKEKNLMDLLIGNKDRVITYDEIENYVWKDFDEVMTSMALRTIIKNLRRKTPIDFLENISGQGYRLNVCE
ncbi:hypothetical protein A9Q76_01790 [Arcobacter sp. 31_11_sub10_T18]|nr:hypothetical protein A9Q76_01790 [Arcobacter sp. 31_11_sub10_T18]